MIEFFYSIKNEDNSNKYNNTNNRNCYELYHYRHKTEYMDKIFKEAVEIYQTQ